jgi:hypothetical protein
LNQVVVGEELVHTWVQAQACTLELEQACTLELEQACMLELEQVYTLGLEQAWVLGMKLHSHAPKHHGGEAERPRPKPSMRRGRKHQVFRSALFVR